MFKLDDAAYSICLNEPNKIPLFAQAYAVDVETIKSHIKEREEKRAEEKKRKEATERRKAKLERAREFISNVENIEINSLVSGLYKDAQSVAKEMSDEHDSVSIRIFLGENESGKICFRPIISGLKSTVTKPKSKTKYIYSDGGNDVDMSLKSYVLFNYPDSKAAKRLLENKNLVAWIAIKSDPELRSAFSRRPE